MRLLTSRIRGAIGIWMGLHVDEVNIDFRKTGPGLLGFVGPFGCGKSTVLANLHPYRSVPGHKGGFARQYRLKDSCRDLLYKIGDDEYRFLIEINATAARLFVKSTVYKNGEPLNLDGGEKSYNEQVEKLFGSEPLYFASAFMAQSPVSFSSMIPSERSAAILQLFNCEHYQAKYIAAGEKGAEVKRQILLLDNTINQLNIGLTGWELLATKITEAQLEVTHYENELWGKGGEIKTAEADYERLQGLYTAQEVTRSQLATAKARLEELIAQHKKMSGDYDFKLGQLRQQIDSDQSTIDKIDAEYTPEGLARIDGFIVAADIAKAAYLETLDDGQRYNELFMAHTDAKTAYDLAKQKSDAERRQLFTTLERLKRAAKILEKVPCQQLEEGTAIACHECQFIKDAVSAGEQIEELRTKEVFDNNAWARKAVELQTTMYLAQNAILLLNYDSAKAERLRAEHQRYEKLNPVALKHQYDIAVEKRFSLTQRVNENRATLGTLQSEANKATTELSAQIGQLNFQVDALEKLIDTTIEDQVRNAGIATDSARQEQRYFTEKLATAKATLVTLQENKEKADVANEQLQAEKVKLGVLQSHLADWDHLAASLSRNGGFQSMLIESLGVQMMPFCNELLAMYGRPWTMEILTSMESVTTKGKIDDGFWVFVNRPEGRTELKDLSGGEEKIVDEILQSAAMLLVRQRSGLQIETVVRDESDGALDPDGALRYFNNIQAAHNVSGVYQTLIVTHRQELIDMIPQRLRFVPGVGVKLEVE
jgi:exonuclease SbcC